MSIRFKTAQPDIRNLSIGNILGPYCSTVFFHAQQFNAMEYPFLFFFLVKYPPDTSNKCLQKILKHLIKEKKMKFIIGVCEIFIISLRKLGRLINFIFNNLIFYFETL